MNACELQRRSIAATLSSEGDGLPIADCIVGNGPTITMKPPGLFVGLFKRVSDEVADKRKCNH
jgi:hypothetical protein